MDSSHMTEPSRKRPTSSLDNTEAISDDEEDSTKPREEADRENSENPHEAAEDLVVDQLDYSEEFPKAESAETSLIENDATGSLAGSDVADGSQKEPSSSSDGHDEELMPSWKYHPYLEEISPEIGASTTLMMQMAMDDALNDQNEKKGEKKSVIVDESGEEQEDARSNSNHGSYVSTEPVNQETAEERARRQQEEENVDDMLKSIGLESRTNDVSVVVQLKHE